MKYHTLGLLVCLEVAAFTRNYVDSQDVLSRWIGSLERCSPSDGLLASELVCDYQTYCRSEDETYEHMTSAAMGKKLKQRGFVGKHTSAGKRYGLRAKDNAASAGVNADFAKKPMNVQEILAEVFGEE